MQYGIKKISCPPGEKLERAAPAQGPAGDVERVHVLKDRDDGRLVYEIGFVEADYQYNYEIAASNGKILDKEIEQNNNVQNTQSAAAQDDTQTGSEKTTEISIEQAKQLVLDRVQGA